MAGADRPVINVCLDDSDEGFDQGDSPSSGPHDDPTASPLFRVKRSSKHIFERHLVPKLIQDLFCTTPAEVLTRELADIMKVLTNVAEDSFLKAEVLEHIPDLAAQAVENSARVSALKDVVGEYLIPLVVRSLDSCEANVDKAAQTALVQMIERGHISQFQVEIQVCPAILALSKVESQQDMNTGPVVLMSRLATLLGRNITERIFLPRFVELCCGSVFYIRKILASRIGNFCAVVGREAFEKMVLPSYLGLCADEIWDVRKSCAEVMIFVSTMCDAGLRRDLLAPAFVKLLRDDCRWVRMSAFQTLGPFIATFATPPVTRITTNAAGDAVLVNTRDGCEFVQKGGIEQFSYNSMMASCSRVVFCHDDDDDDDDAVADSGFDLGDLCRDGEVGGTPELRRPGGEQTTSAGDGLPAGAAAAATATEEAKQVNNPSGCGGARPLDDFTEYNYWYISPGFVDVADDLTQRGALEVQGAKRTTPTFGELPNGGDSQRNADAPSPSDANCDSSSAVNSVNKPQQNIVPQDLVDYYVSMCESKTALEVDGDMAYHCAYSFPAVAVTLGRENYPLLGNTLALLSSDMQYKVRLAVASSLHVVADVLGVDGTSEHLVPLFEAFMRDLDEVRIGILKHLAAFLRRVDATKRAHLSSKLVDFLAVENVCKWRFRETLAEQLTESLVLLRPKDIMQRAGVCSHALMFDNVAAVRQAAMSLATEIVKRIGPRKNKSYYLAMTAERFGHSKKWKSRQTFALLCARLLSEQALPLQEFASEVLPHLLDLSWDPVANVRLVVAKCLVERILTEEYFVDPANEHRLALENVVRRLQADKDGEVRRCVATVDLAKGT